MLQSTYYDTSTNSSEEQTDYYTCVSYLLFPEQLAIWLPPLRLTVCFAASIYNLTSNTFEPFYMRELVRKRPLTPLALLSCSS